VDALKRAEIALKEQAERDPLTKLLNKASTQQLVTEYLTEREDNALAALLLLDLDNFKAVNDNYGHLYGDTVLSQVGYGLKRLFRGNDIIGRMGGDEFLILMKDIPHTDLVQTRCRQLLDTLRPKLEEVAPGLNVSCSIGAALIPAHGTSYTELFRRSDEALYLAKSEGKNTFVLYNPADQRSFQMASGARTATRIDSDEQPGMANASFVRFVFRQLYESHDIERTFNEILAYVGEQLNVSRVYIFENNEDNTTCSNTFEWCNTGVEPQIEILQNVSYIDDIAGWPDVFNEKGIFYCTDITTLEPHFRAILEPQGIKSMLHCSILDNGVFRGYVGFDDCTRHRLWTQDQVDLLQFLSEVLAMFLVKKRMQDRITRQADNMRRILDSQDAWIYVIDPESCDLKFINAKTRKLAPDGRVNTPCYKTFMQRNARCEGCPAENILETGSCSAIVENPIFHLRTNAQATKILWNGEDACLLTVTELEK